MDVGADPELFEHLDQLVDVSKAVAVWPRLAIDDQQRSASCHTIAMMAQPGAV
jgi:hypothetical protein